MNKLNLCFVLLYAALFGWSRASDFSCTPRETYKADCNTCVCSEDGKSAACTMMACVDQPQSTESATDSTTTEGVLEQMESNNHVCTPNDVKMEDCNRCRCAANGIGWFCTRRACPKQLEKRAVKTQCKPGDQWNDGCNNCGCSDDGSVFCTKMACIKLPTVEGKFVTKREAQEPNQCTPGKNWNDGCNTCFCTENGITVCTLMRCFKVDRLRAKRATNANECTPGASWNDGCNSCVCTDTGLSICTKRQCFTLPETRRKRSDVHKKCTPGTHWKSDCNSCFCSDTGVAACTLKGCLKTGFHNFHQHPSTPRPMKEVTEAEYKDSNFTCVPSETFLVECNICECSTDGKSATWCTKKQCSLALDPLPSPTK